MLSSVHTHADDDDNSHSIHHPYANRFASDSSATDSSTAVAKYQLPLQSMPAAAAYQIVHDEMLLNANPHMNLASFVTTRMEAEAERLMAETINVNIADQNVYHQTTKIQHRCVNILANLFHADGCNSSTINTTAAATAAVDDDDDVSVGVGTATVGSSEGLMLALLALQTRWRERETKRTGHDPLTTVSYDPSSHEPYLRRPNYIVSASSHVTVLKFGDYFNAECRVIPFEDGERHMVKAGKVMERIDENTIGVVCVLGTQLTGELDDVEMIHNAIVAHCSNVLQWPDNRTVPIHVDAASGGFLVPFLWPELKWDFRLPHVVSIQTSGHKYGLVYPGIGWVLWRNKQHLPASLIFSINYLGSDEPTFTLNFSRSAATIVAQYYMLLRLGAAGYTRIAQQAHDTAVYMQQLLSELNYFDFLSDLTVPSLPVVAFTLKPQFSALLDADDLVCGVKEEGWTLPKYALPAHSQGVVVLRVVVRETFSRDLAKYFVGAVHATMKKMIAKANRGGSNGYQDKSSSSSSSGSHSGVGNAERPTDNSSVHSGHC